MSYEFLEHISDVKFRVLENKIDQAFATSVKVLTNIIKGKNKINSKKTKEINVKGINLENLLYNFLEEFLFLFDSENFVLSKIKKINVDIKNLKVNAIILGDTAQNYKISNEVKAITYNNMKIKYAKNKWEIICVIDV
jgi:SHS2 domain-containing protein